MIEGAAAKSSAWPVLATVWVVLSIVIPTVVPAVDRIAAPLVCPSETVTPVVVGWSTGSASGGQRAHWRFYCVQADGFAVLANRFHAVVLTSGGSIALLVLAAIARSILRRRR